MNPQRLLDLFLGGLIVAAAVLIVAAGIAQSLQAPAALFLLIAGLSLISIALTTIALLIFLAARHHCRLTAAEATSANHYKG